MADGPSKRCHGVVGGGGWGGGWGVGGGVGGGGGRIDSTNSGLS